MQASSARPSPEPFSPPKPLPRRRPSQPLRAPPACAPFVATDEQPKHGVNAAHRNNTAVEQQKLAHHKQAHDSAEPKRIADSSKWQSPVHRGRHRSHHAQHEAPSKHVRGTADIGGRHRQDQQQAVQVTQHAANVCPMRTKDVAKGTQAKAAAGKPPRMPLPGAAKRAAADAIDMSSPAPAKKRAKGRRTSNSATQSASAKRASAPLTTLFEQSPLPPSKAGAASSGRASAKRSRASLQAAQGGAATQQPAAQWRSKHCSDSGAAAQQAKRQCLPAPRSTQLLADSMLQSAVASEL